MASRAITTAAKSALLFLSVAAPWRAEAGAVLAGRQQSDVQSSGLFNASSSTASAAGASYVSDITTTSASSTTPSSDAGTSWESSTSTTTTSLSVSSSPPPTPPGNDESSSFSSSSSSSSSISYSLLNTLTAASPPDKPVESGYDNSTAQITPTASSDGPSLTTVAPATSGDCEAPTDDSGAVTVWEIVHTSTTTVGDLGTYSPPFSTLSLPTPCAIMSNVAANSGFHVEGGPNEPVAETVTMTTTDKNPAVVSSSITTPNYGGSGQVTSAAEHVQVSSSPANEVPAATVTKVKATTSSSPVTVGVNSGGIVVDGSTYSDPTGSTTNAAGSVVAKQTTQTVVADGQTVVINPSQVIVGGSTISRPSAAAAATKAASTPDNGIALYAQPTSTVVNGLTVEVGSSTAVIGGTTITFATTAGVTAAPTTTVVNGQTVVISGTNIVVGGQTIAQSTFMVTSYKSASGTGTKTEQAVPSETVVVGGQLVTEIGQSVLVVQGTTYTYLSTTPETSVISWTETDGQVTAMTSTWDATTTTLVVGGDTLTLGPDGVVLHGTNLGGGTAAAADATKIVVAGGATLTEIGASLVAIEGVTYTVGPLAWRGGPATTTVVNGQTITIGVGGVTVSAVTFAYPFATATPTRTSSGFTVTITPSHKSTSSSTSTAAKVTKTSSSKAAGATAAGDLGGRGALGWVMVVGVGLLGL